MKGLVNGLYEQIAEAQAAIRKRWQATPKVGLILGTGLGAFASLIETDTAIPYAEIPHFTVSTVASHAGQLVCGRLRGVPLVAMEGRLHHYEGYTMRQVTFPVRVMKALGVEILVMTNAAGGMNPDYQLADVVIIEDHINLMPENPLRGVNDDRLGPRFPDMIAPYDPELIGLAHRVAAELDVPAQRRARRGPRPQSRNAGRIPHVADFGGRRGQHVDRAGSHRRGPCRPADFGIFHRDRLVHARDAGACADRKNRRGRGARRPAPGTSDSPHH